MVLLYENWQLTPKLDGEVNVSSSKIMLNYMQTQFLTNSFEHVQTHSKL